MLWTASFRSQSHTWCSEQKQKLEWIVNRILSFTVICTQATCNVNIDCCLVWDLLRLAPTINSRLNHTACQHKHYCTYIFCLYPATFKPHHYQYTTLIYCILYGWIKEHNSSICNHHNTSRRTVIEQWFSSYRTVSLLTFFIKVKHCNKCVDRKLNFKEVYFVNASLGIKYNKTLKALPLHLYESIQLLVRVSQQI